MSVNSWYKKELCFGKKTRNGNNLKIKFKQRRVKPKCSLDKKTRILQILYQFFLLICNNFKEEICLSKPVFNNTSRRNHSSLINNTVTKKIKYFPELLALKADSRIRLPNIFFNVLQLLPPLKRKLSDFRFRSIFIFNKKSPKIANLPLTDRTLCLSFWRHNQNKRLLQFLKLSSGSYAFL